MVVGTRAACVAEEQIPRVIQEPGIELSKKEESNKPFSEKFTALGAEFDIRGAKPVMKPRLELIEKFERRLNGLRLNEGKLIGIKQKQEFFELFEFFSRFSTAVSTPVSLAHACLRALLRTKNLLCPVSHALIKAAQDMLDEIEHYSGIPVIRNPYFLHPGKHGFTSDARGLAHDMIGGWGVCVAGHCASGAWSAPVIRAMKDSVLSINPLELLSCAMTLCVAKSQSVLVGGTQVLWRNDNLSATTSQSQRQC